MIHKNQVRKKNHETLREVWTLANWPQSILLKKKKKNPRPAETGGCRWGCCWSDSLTAEMRQPTDSGNKEEKQPQAPLKPRFYFIKCAGVPARAWLWFGGGEVGSVRTGMVFISSFSVFCVPPGQCGKSRRHSDRQDRCAGAGMMRWTWAGCKDAGRSLSADSKLRRKAGLFESTLWTTLASSVLLE